MVPSTTSTHKITQQFFARETLLVARELLGTQLVSKIAGKITAGTIVEVEAYRSDDEASHTYRGQTKRNAAMFLGGGHSYIYLIYGMHHCFNIVTEAPGSGSAVLIRALEPTRGIEIMKQRRGSEKVTQLTNGPAKLCQALGITPEIQAHHLLTSKNVWLEPGEIIPEKHIAVSTRIGISKAVDKPWRFYIKGNNFVSK